MVDLLYFRKFQFRSSNNRQWRLRRLDCASEQADPNEDGDHADAGGLENCAKEGRERLFGRSGGSPFVSGREQFGNEENDTFGGSRQKAVFVCSTDGSGSAVLPQDCSQQAQEPRRLGWFVCFSQKTELVYYVFFHKSIKSNSRDS